MMNDRWVDAIRWMDHHIGDALCRVAAKALRRTAAAGVRAPLAGCAPRRVLIIKPWGIGSLIQCYPALRHLRQSFRDADIRLLTNCRNRGLYEGSELLDGFFYFRPESIAASVLWGLPVLLRQLRRFDPDLIVDLDPFARTTALLGFCVSAPVRIGAAIEGNARGRLFTDSIAYHRRMSLRDLTLTIAARAGGEPPLDSPPPPRLHRSSDRSAMQELLLRHGIREHWPLIGICVATDFGVARRWPLERFARYADRAIEQYGARVLFVGGAGDRALVGATLARMEHRRHALDLTGATTLPQLSALLSLLDLFVTNDTGPMHVAAATGTQTIALFGPADPETFGPREGNVHAIYRGLRCSPCIQIVNAKSLGCRSAAPCMTAIEPDEVLARSTEILALQRARRTSHAAH